VTFPVKKSERLKALVFGVLPSPIYPWKPMGLPLFVSCHEQTNENPRVLQKHIQT